MVVIDILHALEQNDCDHRVGNAQVNEQFYDIYCSVAQVH